MIDADTLIRFFNDLFVGPCRTCLVGGAEEPVYHPADDRDGLHRIVFKEDFGASALHEVAHWCIAGSRRRQLEDYGYWYQPDRGAGMQGEFQRVECGPQALEWILSVAAGRPFRVSFDKLDDPEAGGDDFRRAVQSAVFEWLASGLPPRAWQFVEALAAYRGIAAEDVLSPLNYNQLPR